MDIRDKVHALVAAALKVLVERAESVARYFAKKLGNDVTEYRRKLAERFGKGPMRCPACGSVKLLLIRIWSKTAGLIYDILQDGVSQTPVVDSSAVGSSVVCGPVEKQMVLAI